MNTILLFLSIIVCIFVYFFLIYRPDGEGVPDRRGDKPKAVPGQESVRGDSSVSPQGVPSPRTAAGSRRSAFDDILSGKAEVHSGTGTDLKHGHPKQGDERQAVDELRRMKEIAREVRDMPDAPADGAVPDVWENIGSDEVPEVDAESRFLTGDSLRGLRQLKDLEYDIYVADTEAEFQPGVKDAGQDGVRAHVPAGPSAGRTESAVLPVQDGAVERPSVKERPGTFPLADVSGETYGMQQASRIPEAGDAAPVPLEDGTAGSCSGSFEQNRSGIPFMGFPHPVDDGVQRVPPVREVPSGNPGMTPKAPAVSRSERKALEGVPGPVQEAAASGAADRRTGKGLREPQPEARAAAAEGLKERLKYKSGVSRSSRNGSLFDVEAFSRGMKQHGTNIVGPNGERISFSSDTAPEPVSPKGSPVVPEADSLSSAAAGPAMENSAQASAKTCGAGAQEAEPSAADTLFQAVLAGRRWSFRLGDESRFVSCTQFESCMERVFRLHPSCPDSMATRNCLLWVEPMDAKAIPRTLGDRNFREPYRARLRNRCREALQTRISLQPGGGDAEGPDPSGRASGLLCHRRLELVVSGGESGPLSSDCRGELFRWCRDLGASLPGGAVLKACIEHSDRPDRPYHVHLVYMLPVPEAR